MYRSRRTTQAIVYPVKRLTNKRESNTNYNVGSKKPRGANTFTRKGLRSGYLKKRTRQGAPRRAAGPHMQHGLLNPFTLLRDPKIPDGSCQFSHGRQFRINSVINIPANATLEGLMYPGFTSGLFINNSDGAINGALAHMFWHPSFTDLNVTPTASTDATFQQVPLEIARWRAVSYGLKMTLLNTDQQNDGWFETSLGTKALNDAHVICATTGASSPSINTQAGYGTALTNVVVGLNPENFIRSTPANDPGFRAGALKNLHKHVFTLPRLNNDAEFIPMSETTSARFGTLPFPSKYFALANSPTGAPSELRSRMFDDQLCCRYFTITAGTSGSTILFEYAANLEFVYDETSGFNDFQTPNVKMSGVSNLLSAQQKQVHPKTEPMDFGR